MLPQSVATLGAHGLAHAAPQFGGLAGLPRPQLEPHEGGEGLLGGTAGGPAAQPHLAQLVGAGQAVAHGGGDHRVHPALDERQQGFQTAEGGLVDVGDLGADRAGAAGEHLLQLGRVLQHGRVEPGGQIVETGGVHTDAARVLVDRGQEPCVQPGGAGEQSQVGGLAGGENTTTSCRGSSSSSANASIAVGQSAATPSSPNGMPTSEENNTAGASLPRP